MSFPLKVIHVSARNPTTCQPGRSSKTPRPKQKQKQKLAPARSKGERDQKQGGATASAKHNARSQETSVGKAPCINTTQVSSALSHLSHGKHRLPHETRPLITNLTPPRHPLHHIRIVIRIIIPQPHPFTASAATTDGLHNTAPIIPRVRKQTSPAAKAWIRSRASC